MCQLTNVATMKTGDQRQIWTHMLLQDCLLRPLCLLRCTDSLSVSVHQNFDPVLRDLACETNGLRFVYRLLQDLYFLFSVGTSCECVLLHHPVQLDTYAVVSMYDSVFLAEAC